MSKNQKQQILIFIAFAIVSFVLWSTVFIYPIKLFVVMLHEMSHGIAAIAFGGKIVAIQVSPQIGGFCKYLAPAGFFSRIVIASAGYLGSLVFGGIILILGARYKKARLVTFFIGIVSFVLSYFVIKQGELFGIIFVLSFGAFMLLAFFFFPPVFHSYFLKFIGFVSCFYVILDIYDDLIRRSGIGSDADAIAALTGIPSIVIGIIWILIAIVALFYILRSALRGEQTTGSQEKAAS